MKNIPVIGKVITDLDTLVEMMKAFFAGQYELVPVGVFVAIIATLIFILSPIDLVPDFIPVLGWIDDALVFTLVLELGLSSELERYREWTSLQEQKREQEQRDRESEDEKE